MLAGTFFNVGLNVDFKAGFSIGFKAISFGLVMVLLAGCEDRPPYEKQRFQQQYTTARRALENEKYDKANRIYEQLLPRAGPLTPRIQLEYSHSLLRAGNYDKAAETARQLADNQPGEARGAALSVLGTAEHELAIIALQNGMPDAAKQHLLSAQSAMQEVLRTYPTLDPLGTLSGRLANVQQQIQTLA
jgi:outer membrane protein assembly factor BamD (BamD/ComL family)